MSEPSDLATSAQAVAAAVLAACADPADAVRLLTKLAEFSVTLPPNGTDPIGLAMTDMQSACSDLMRRAGVVALARATAAYQPASSNDAYSVMAAVTGLLDNEIAIAADQGQNATYLALRALRVAVVQDLMTRGASLAAIASFSFNAPLPAIVIALRLYRDPSRDAELVTQANPVHPLFMPLSFQALAS